VSLFLQSRYPSLLPSSPSPSPLSPFCCDPHNYVFRAIKYYATKTYMAKGKQAMGAHRVVRSRGSHIS
jgi:hypothetical protein